MQLQIKKVNPNAIIPTRNNPTDSGLDIYACLDNDVVIPSLIDECYQLDEAIYNIQFNTETVQWKNYITDIETNNPSALIPTGIAIKLPDADITNEFAYEAQIRPISIQGLLVHWGTYHLPYTGEIKVFLYNLTNKPVVIKHGMRIAQLVIAPIFLPDLVECDFNVTGVNGFDK